MASKSDASGSSPRSTGPRKQARNSRIMMAKPDMAAGCRTRRPRASRVWLRPRSTATRSLRAASVIAHLRIEKRVAEIDDEIGDDDEKAIEDNHAQNERVVAIEGGIDEVAADAGNAENLLDDDGTRHGAGRSRSKVGHDRHHRANQGMTRDRAPAADTFRARRADMVGAQRFDHAAAGQAGDVGDVR